MGSLKVIDFYDTTFNQKKYLCIVLYNDKNRCLCKIYKLYDETLCDFLSERLYQDVSSYVQPRIKRDGSTSLDLEI